MNAITLLKDDHRRVKALFRRYQQLGERAHRARAAVVAQIIEELSTHAAIEELVFYPQARARVPAVEDEVLESLEEHHIVKWTLDELEKMNPREERYNAKVTVLIENVKHHIDEEEKGFFPRVSRALGRRGLEELGEELQQARSAAPTRPHPRAPQTPPGNIIATAAAVPMDAVLRGAKRARSSIAKRVS